MSGGAFNYNQYKIGYIIEEIEEVINDNGREKTEEELKKIANWRDPDWYEKYPEDLFHYKYPDEVIDKMKEGIEVLKRAQIYAQRIDWLLSGDDGIETFFERLEEDLNNLKNE
jgi:hypothetical protein